MKNVIYFVIYGNYGGGVYGGKGGLKMKIVNDRTRVNVTFERLYIGATFMFDRKLYMKINYTDAVNLHNGLATSVDDNNLVEPVKVELHIVD